MSVQRGTTWNMYPFHTYWSSYTQVIQLYLLIKFFYDYTYFICYAEFCRCRGVTDRRYQQLKTAEYIGSPS